MSLQNKKKLLLVRVSLYKKSSRSKTLKE
ncbi:unnamed protein product [Oikopleura dioica]|uniref:Uncharacterized protein n=1 Tax=Oikopleura dioica TaxID=34765 RepID=E4Z3J6_OIKDI|nr:unnamed protein product [Oikopleura dioica]